jgi:hypothetical protein
MKTRRKRKPKPASPRKSAGDSLLGRMVEGGPHASGDGLIQVGPIVHNALLDAIRRNPDRYAPSYRFSAGAYWCTQIGLFPVIEPYINCGGMNGYGFGIRASWFGGNAYAEWWKP